MTGHGFREKVERLRAAEERARESERQQREDRARREAETARSDRAASDEMWNVVRHVTKQAGRQEDPVRCASSGAAFH